MLIGGKVRDVKVIGTDDYLATVRNIAISSGRFLDASDVSLREKVALLTDHAGANACTARAPRR